ncbi:MAG: hypothetical protein PF480_13035, partial [Roseovarius sp.]|nr:hypothetical protein [Roseovarius sp.]
PGKRTVSACLRMTGRAAAKNFSSYHQLLNRARWKPCAMSRRLLAIQVVERAASIQGSISRISGTTSFLSKNRNGPCCHASKGHINPPSMFAAFDARCF